ncbi:MAG: hypothetical protein IJT88_09625 [Kiritimatiellae bacterium]|nr:hypothetical protein [Kiritimatiellia bacterium]
MAARNEIVELVRARLRGIPEPAARVHVRRALAEVCRDTKAWTCDLTATVPDGQEAPARGPALLTLSEIPFDADIFALLGVEGVTPRGSVMPLPAEAFRLRGPVLEDPRSLSRGYSSVRVRVALVPRLAGRILEEAPEPLLNRISDLVTELATAYAAGETRMPWADPQLAQASLWRYQRALGRHNAIAMPELRHYHVLPSIEE